MSDNKIRLALIGLGKMGISHLSIAGGNPHVEIVGVCDTSKMVLTFLEKQTPFKVYDDYRKMIVEVNPQAVILSVPTKHHAEIIEELLDKNMHVFAEKPLTLDAATSQKLANKAEALGLVNQVGYHNHFIGTFIELKRLLHKKILGDLYHFTAESYGPVVTKSKDSTWRSKQDEGGGCLYDYASHVIDLVNFTLSEIVGVSGVELKKIFSKEVEDAVYGTLHLKSGISGTLSVNWSDPTYRKMSTKLTVFGKNGKIIADATELKIYLNEQVKGESYDKGWTTVSIGSLQAPVDFYLRGEEYTAELDYFISSIQQGEKGAQHNFKQGAMTDRAIALIRKSID
ncbi:MAG: Gfo/Idh/MocA family protein [Chitinophagaceae bacterium]